MAGRGASQAVLLQLGSFLGYSLIGAGVSEVNRFLYPPRTRGVPGSPAVSPAYERAFGERAARRTRPAQRPKSSSRAYSVGARSSVNTVEVARPHTTTRPPAPSGERTLQTFRTPWAARGA